MWRLEGEDGAAGCRGGGGEGEREGGGPMMRLDGHGRRASQWGFVLKSVKKKKNAETFPG